MPRSELPWERLPASVPPTLQLRVQTLPVRAFWTSENQAPARTALSKRERARGSLFWIFPSVACTLSSTQVVGGLNTFSAIHCRESSPTVLGPETAGLDFDVAGDLRGQTAASCSKQLWNNTSQGASNCCKIHPPPANGCDSVVKSWFFHDVPPVTWWYNGSPKKYCSWQVQLLHLQHVHWCKPSLELTCLSCEKPEIYSPRRVPGLPWRGCRDRGPGVEKPSNSSQRRQTSHE